MNEVKKLAEAGGWTIPDSRVEEIKSAYASTMEDTRPVRDLDLGWTPPTTVFKADQE